MSMPGGVSTISPDADTASTAAQRYGVIVHGIYATGVGRMGRNAWEAQLGQGGVGKIATTSGGEILFSRYTNSGQLQTLSGSVAARARPISIT